MFPFFYFEDPDIYIFPNLKPREPEDLDVFLKKFKWYPCTQIGNPKMDYKPDDYIKKDYPKMRQFY